MQLHTQWVDSLLSKQRASQTLTDFQIPKSSNFNSILNDHLEAGEESNEPHLVSNLIGDVSGPEIICYFRSLRRLVLWHCLAWLGRDEHETLTQSLSLNPWEVLVFVVGLYEIENDELNEVKQAVLNRSFCCFASLYHGIWLLSFLPFASVDVFSFLSVL